MIAQLSRHETLMDRERSTRAEPIALEELKKVREHLQSSLDNLDGLIESMERAKLETVMLRFKTREAAARDWYLFSKGLDQAFEAELLRDSTKKSGQAAKDRDRRNSGK